MVKRKNVKIKTSASYSFTMRIKIPNKPGSFARVAGVIGNAGGDLDGVDIVATENNFIIRDVTVHANGDEHAEQILKIIKKLKGFEVVSSSDNVFLMHLGGKIEVHSKFPLSTRAALSMAYTPGVARVCMSIHRNKKKAFNLTIKKNMVAVVTDGTAVLGLGDIGPEAAMPVMEGKCMLFKEFAGVDAFPIALKTKSVDEIVRTVELIAPGFGGINLEDISAPRCFEIEDRLKKSLNIPVFHDDQHGTAVVVLSALLNAVKIVKKDLKKIRVVISGAGAAGIACCRMIMKSGVRKVILCDRCGALYKGRTEGMNPMKNAIVQKTNPDGMKGSLKQVLKGADVFLGVSAPGLLSRKDIKTMAKKPIVFAMSNPDPEVRPEEIMNIAHVIGTGRSDYPNQINNVLCFPGIFKGTLACQAREINESMKLAAAKAIAETIPPSQLGPEHIIPSVFNDKVTNNVADAVAKAAIRSGAADSPQKGKN